MGLRIKILSFITFSLLFSQFYTFSDNIRLTESLNNQKFPEAAINSNYIHIAWVAVSGNNKNIVSRVRHNQNLKH